MRGLLWTTGLVAVVVLLLGSVLVGTFPSGSGADQRASAPREEVHSTPRTVAGPTTSFPAAPRPGATGTAVTTATGPLGTYYMQEGAQFFQVAGSSSTYFTHLSETFVLPAGSVPTAFELNGVTSTGDWIQMNIGDDWPYANACPIPTYTLAFELWDSAGNSQSTGADWWGTGFLGCAQAFVPHLGDVIGLTMSLNCPAGGTGSVCLTYTDQTQGVSAVNVQTQPSYSEHGMSATYFVNGGSPLVTAHRYFVGPATESIVLLASSCPNFHQPFVSYVLNSSDNLPITQYVAWADEFEYFSGFVCQVNSISVGTGSDPSTTYSSVSGASTFGAHVVAGQNWTAAQALVGITTPVFEYRFETDPPALNFAFIANPSSLDTGQTLSVNSVSTGPGTCYWSFSLGATVVSGPTTECSWSGAAPDLPGAVDLRGYLVDVSGNIAEADQLLNVDPAPEVFVSANVSTVPAYRPVTFSADALSAPDDPITGYAWSGLPRSCHASSALATFACIPTQWGVFSVSVAVTDAHGLTQGAFIPAVLTVTNPCAAPGSCFTARFTGPPSAWQALLLVTCTLCHADATILPMNGSKTGSVAFEVPNGSYRYLVEGPGGNVLEKLTPYGNLSVNGSNDSMALAFVKGPTSTLTFAETGLPKNLGWCVTVGQTLCTTGRTISFRNLTAGEYGYTVLSIDGYGLRASERGQPLPSYGWLYAAGKAPRVTLTFQPNFENVTINETGLPKGATWCVDIAKGKNYCSAIPTLLFREPNGTFSYSWRAKGKGFTGGSDSFEVQGAPLYRTVLFIGRGSISPAVTAPEPEHASSTRSASIMSAPGHFGPLSGTGLWAMVAALTLAAVLHRTSRGRR